MMCYLVQLRDLTFVKRYGFLSFAKNMGNKITSKNLSAKYSQKPFDPAKRSATDGFKNPSKKAIQLRVEETCELIGNKIANRITKVSKNSKSN